jgi:hypothetical protein
MIVLRAGANTSHVCRLGGAGVLPIRDSIPHLYFIELKLGLQLTILGAMRLAPYLKTGDIVSK